MEKAPKLLEQYELLNAKDTFVPKEYFPNPGKAYYKEIEGVLVEIHVFESQHQKVVLMQFANNNYSGKYFIISVVHKDVPLNIPSEYILEKFDIGKIVRLINSSE